MTGNTEKTYFTTTKTNLEEGNYSVWLIAKDIFGYQEIYEDQFRFCIGGCEPVGITTTIAFVLFGSTIVILEVIRRKKK